MAKKNRNKLIDILNNEPLTFTELINKSKLSRAVVHRNLTVFEKEGLIKKEYKNGKLEIILNFSKLNLVEWFLDQLTKYDVPISLIEKGRTELKEKVILAIANMYLVRIISVILSINNIERKKLKITKFKDISSSALTGFQKYSKTEMPDMIKRREIIHSVGVNTKDELVNLSETERQTKIRALEEGLKRMLKDITPYSFHIGLIIFTYEKQMLNGKSLDNELLPLFITPVLDDETKKNFLVACEWWREVSEYLPGLSIIDLLTLNYFNRMLRYTKELLKVFTSKDITVIEFKH